MPTQDVDNYDEILATGELVRVVLPLLPGEMNSRVLLAVPAALDWMKRELPNMTRDGFVAGEVTPKEQALTIMRSFVAGHDFSPPLPHDMGDVESGIWELRTDDLRFFGWFPRVGMFCLSAVAKKKTCREARLYTGFKTQAIRHRECIGLYGGAYITGEIDDLL